ncbi:MAG TPA: NifU family protein [Longimicrobiales bacterium]|nr:NifU family protein [Longimicrobiales bacterium]
MITFTDRAREMVQAFVAENEGEDLALRIGMSGSPVSPTFDLTLVGLIEQAPDEVMVDGGGFVVLVRQADSALLEGATVDYVERVNESGFEVRPAGAAPARKSGIPTGEIADRVRNVLETQVNPAIAAHGGMISLVDVEDTDVYVEMSGGCQGCALSRMTLRQGVERMLREAVPELTAVHDVTDHASGDNPYL